MDEDWDEGGKEEADERGDGVGRVAVIRAAVRQALLPGALVHSKIEFAKNKRENPSKDALKRFEKVQYWQMQNYAKWENTMQYSKCKTMLCRPVGR